MDKSGKFSNNQEERAFIYARSGDSQNLKRIINSKLANDSSTTDEGLSLLMAAIKSRDINTVLLVLAVTTNINYQTTRGITALHVAIMTPRIPIDIVKLILEKSPNLCIRDNFGETALHKAAGAIIISDSDPDNNNNDYSEEVIADKIVLNLLRAGNPPNIEDNYGWTPLMYAALAKRRTAFQLLYDYGAHPDHKAMNGMTALHLMVLLENEVGIQLLKSVGAKSDIKDCNGQYPCNYATDFIKTILNESVTKLIHNEPLPTINTTLENGCYMCKSSAAIYCNSMGRYICADCDRKQKINKLELSVDDYWKFIDEDISPGVDSINSKIDDIGHNFENLDPEEMCVVCRRPMNENY